MQTSFLLEDNVLIGAIDTLANSLKTAGLVGDHIRADTKLKLKIRNHGRRSWIPTDLAGEGS
jgi:hypothetical protein